MERTIAFKEQLSDAVSPVSRLISMMPVASAVVCADETLSVVSANAGFYSLLHTAPSQKLQFFHADKTDCMRLYKEFRRPAREGDIFDTEFHYSYGDGNGIWIRLWATLYGQVEDVDLYLCCFLDVTAEKERDATGEFLSSGAVSFLKKMVGSGQNVEMEENHENPWRKFAEEETRLALENHKLKEEAKAAKEENNDRYLCDLSCKKTGTCSMTVEKKEI